MGRYTEKINEKYCIKKEYFLDSSLEKIDENRDLICGAPVDKLASYEEAEEKALLIAIPCMVGDEVWELCRCYDGKQRIFPMQIKNIVPFGSPRMNGNMPETWNIYAEGEYTKMYKSFYDIGKTVFFDEEEAKRRLKEIEVMDNAKKIYPEVC